MTHYCEDCGKAIGTGQYCSACQRIRDKETARLNPPPSIPQRIKNFAAEAPLLAGALGLIGFLLVGNVIKHAFDLGPKIQTQHTPEAEADTREDARTGDYDAALAEVRAEKRVLAASWGPYKASSLYVAVKDDGTRRDGFAEYLCMTLNDHKLNNIIIHIMVPKDYREYNTANDIGRHVCSIPVAQQPGSDYLNSAEQALKPRLDLPDTLASQRVQTQNLPSTQEEASQMLELMAQQPGHGRYAVSFYAPGEVTLFNCDLIRDTLEREHYRDSGGGSKEVWKGDALYRIRAGASGETLNETPHGSSLAIMTRF